MRSVQRFQPVCVGVDSAMFYDLLGATVSFSPRTTSVRRQKIMKLLEAM